MSKALALMHSLDGTLGAAFLGALVAAVLYGVTSVQAFLYFSDCKQDGRWLRGMVLFLWILDTLHIAFTAHGLYFYMVTSFGDFTVLLSPTWTILAQVYITSLNDLIVRAFFAQRVSILCGERAILRVVLPIVINILSIVVFSFGCGFASRSFVLKTYFKMREASFMLYGSLGTAVLVDSLIAISLCILLVRNRTGFKKTDSIVSRLMLFTINTGLLTSIAATACFVTYAIWPQRFIFMGIYFALSKLYANSLLASLNARKVLRRQSLEDSSPLNAEIMTPIFPTEKASFLHRSLGSDAV